MIVYENHFVQAIAYLAYFCIACGLLNFIIQIVRWDREYEDFIIFPLRFAIYLIPYLLVPGLGLVIGGFFLRSKARVKRKFAIASMYVSGVGLLLYSTAPWTGIA